MRWRRKLVSVACAAAVMALCSINLTYAWTNLHQTALNVYEREIGAPDTPEVKPDPNPSPNPTPTDPKPEGSGSPASPSQGGSSGTTQSGKSDMTTGDACEFVFYMIVMLVSFAVMIVLGAVLIALLIHEWEKRRRKQEVR